MVPPRGDAAQSVIGAVGELLEQYGNEFDRALAAEIVSVGVDIADLARPGHNPWRRLLVQSVWRSVANDLGGRKPRLRERDGSGRSELTERRDNLFLRYMAYQELESVQHARRFNTSAAISAYIADVAQGQRWAVRDARRDDCDAVPDEFIDAKGLAWEAENNTKAIRLKDEKALREAWGEYKNQKKRFSIEADVKKWARYFATAGELIDSLECRALEIVERSVVDASPNRDLETYRIMKIVRGAHADMDGAFVSVASSFTDNGPEGAQPVTVPNLEWMPYLQAMVAGLPLSGLILCDAVHPVEGRSSHLARLEAAGLIEPLNHNVPEVLLATWQDALARARPYLFSDQRWTSPAT